MKRFLITVILLVNFICITAQENDTDHKKLSFTPSGFVNLNTIFDFNGLDNYDDFTTSQIPIHPTPYENTFRFHMTARQSRLNLDVNYLSSYGKLHAFVSGDFYSGNTSSISYFRLREAYLEFGRFLLGQTNTTFGNNDIVPATVDFEGPNSGPTLRNPMLRYLHQVGKNWSYSIAIEMRGTDISTFPNTGNPFIAMPGIVGSVNKKGNWGVVTLSGMVDITRYFDADSAEQIEYGYGGSISLILNTWKQNHFSIYFVTGKGVSNFISDLSGNGYNGVPDLETNKMVMLNSIGGFVGYTQYWSDKLSSNFIYSYILLEKNPLLANDDFKYSIYALVNLFYSPFSRFNFGVEFVQGKLVIQDGNSGNANRLQFLAQFNF